jgi:hypothetical protein
VGGGRTPCSRAGASYDPCSHKLAGEVSTAISLSNANRQPKRSKRK